MGLALLFSALTVTMGCVFSLGRVEVLIRDLKVEDRVGSDEVKRESIDDTYGKANEIRKERHATCKEEDTLEAGSIGLLRYCAEIWRQTGNNARILSNLPHEL